MKKLLMVLTLTASMSQAFGAAAFIVANGSNPDGGIGLGGLSTTTTTSVYASPLAGLVVFLDGEPAVNLASEEAQELIASAEEAIEEGAELTEDEAAIMEMVESHE